MIVFKILFSILAFACGASLASFAGVVAYRLPQSLSISKPNSYCASCQKPIKIYDNIPIVSWILLKGKCRYCNAKIGIFSFLIEIFGGLGFMFSYLVYGSNSDTLLIFIALILMVFLFIIIAAIDHETHDIYNITLIIFGIIALFISTYKIIVFNKSLWLYIFGAILGFAFFGAIKIISKTILKKDALGSGDVYLVGIAGMMLGAFPLLISIIIATLLGSIVEIIKIKTNKSDVESEIAFAPYLLFGIAIMAIYGDLFMNFYWEVVLNAFI